MHLPRSVASLKYPYLGVDYVTLWDRRRLQATMEKDSNEDLIRAMSTMAYDLGREVVAEGIETTDQ